MSLTVTSAPSLSLPALESPAFSEALRALAEIYGTDGDGHGEALETSTLTDALLDGARPLAERVVAGTILASWSQSRAIRITTLGLVRRLDAGDRRRLSGELDSAGWPPEWTAPVQDDAPVRRSLFRAGLEAGGSDREETVADLQLLNDTLSTSALVGRYWITGSLLRGWAIDGELPSDQSPTFEFAFSGLDIVRMRRAVVDLTRVGFLPRFRYPGPGQELRALCFIRHGATFSFRRMDPDGSGHQSAYSYGIVGGAAVESRHRHLCQPLAPISFLDRLWLKPEDHDRQLTEEYGDWRSPTPDWDHTRSPSIVAQTPWSSNGYDFLGVALS